MMFVLNEAQTNCITREKINEYLDEFKRKRDGIHCILYTVGIGSIILSIYCVKTLLLVSIVTVPIEIGLLTLSIWIIIKFN